MRQASTDAAQLDGLQSVLRDDAYRSHLLRTPARLRDIGRGTELDVRQVPFNRAHDVEVSSLCPRRTAVILRTQVSVSPLLYPGG